MSCCKSWYKFFLTVFLSNFFFYSFGQLPERELAWKNIGIEGRNATVYCIFQDNQGVIWLGSDNGLFFYDGLSTNKVGEEEIGDYHVYALTQKDNLLFVGTNNGLFQYDYSTGYLRHSEGIVPGEIRSLLLQGDNLWIGGLYGIYMLNLENNEASNMSEGLPSPSVYSILRDSRGILYAGTYNGLARWDSLQNDFHPVLIDSKAVTQNFFVNCLLESEDKRSIYVGGENSLYRYTPSTDKWEKSQMVSGVNVKSLTHGIDGHLIVGTDDGLFDVFMDSVRHYRHDSRLPHSIAHNEIWSVMTDEQSNIWTGHERGLSIASGSNIIKSFNLGQITQNGEGNEISNIYRDTKKNLWLGGSNGLILLPLNGKAEWFRHTVESNSISHNRIRDILETENGSLWFATDGGVNKYDGKSGFLNYKITDSSGSHDANWAYSLEENGSRLLIGSFLGGVLGIDTIRLQALNEKTGKGLGPKNHMIADISINSEAEPWLQNNLVNQIVKDGYGNIWVLLFRDNSLVKFNKDLKKLEDYNIFELSGVYPTHITADSKGRIWCAFKGGAIMFDEQGEKEIVKFDSSFVDETVLAIAPVGNDLWVSTRSNVWKIDGDTFQSSLLPIPQKSFTAIFEDPFSKKILLGGTDELVEIDSELLNDSKDFRKVKLIIEETGDGKWHFFGDRSGINKLVLPHGGSLKLIISSLNYSPGVTSRYMYKLADNPKDSVGDWRILPEGSNVVTLSDIKMGNYFLMFKTESDPEISLIVPLEVKAPPALSWWAITLYAFSLVSLISIIIWVLNKKRRRDLEIQQRETELKNVERKLSFLSSISHDLKTPLSMILGPVSIMKENVKDKDTKRSLESVYDNAVRLNNMIHKTIELQHIEDVDESFVILSNFEIVEFCKSIFDVFSENNPNRKFIFFSNPERMFIEADAVKMESIITNLLSNACKYSFDGSTISLGICSDGKNVEITVSDDGIGIPEEDQPLVFHKMFRSPSTLNIREGSGLGLYLIKRYIEAMNGRIELFSKSGEGSSFTISLPMTSQPEVKLNEKSLGQSDKPKILIVEDNSQISSFLKEILKKNYTSLIAENGKTGLSLAGSFQPDLIIADEVMPVMNGLQMIQRIKENPKLSTIPVIMLTAKTDNNTETESIKHGVDIFMGKPFDPNTLLGRVEQLLKRRKEILEKVRIETIVENESKPIEAESVNEKTLAKIIRIIEENISDPDLNVEMLSNKSGLSNKNLYRLIKKTMGKAPLEFIREMRLRKAASLLTQKRFTVSEICYMVGFKTPSYFAKCFQNLYGVIPSEYNENHT